MRLYELAYCCHVFSLEVYDSATVELRSATGLVVDPGNPDHVGPLFTWLRKWGCRQFAIHDEEVASASLDEWWRSQGRALPSFERALDELDEQELDSIAAAYEELRPKAGELATQRQRDGCEDLWGLLEPRRRCTRSDRRVVLGGTNQLESGLACRPEAMVTAVTS